MAITIKEVAFAGNLSLQLGGIRLRLALTPYPIAQNSYALQFNFNHVARVKRRSFTVGAGENKIAREQGDMVADVAHLKASENSSEVQIYCSMPSQYCNRCYLLPELSGIFA
jgi:hypothetical protein